MPELSSQGAYIPMQNSLLISYSPEIFLRIHSTKHDNSHQILKTFPIKGTLSDTLPKNILLKNPKEHTEQVMVVDLLRNDLGSICDFNSVKVKEFKKIKQQDNLYQMYSQIEAKIKLTKENFITNLLKIMPAGSVTGAPKNQVCQFLHQIENKNRSFYTGIAGYYDFQQNSGFFNLLIRMLEINNQHDISIGVGAGITIDSIWQNEIKELKLKETSILRRFFG